MMSQGAAPMAMARGLPTLRSTSSSACCCSLSFSFSVSRTKLSSPSLLLQPGCFRPAGRGGRAKQWNGRASGADTLGVVGAEDVGRRQACLDMATTMLASAGLLIAGPEHAVAREVEVGSYLPAAEGNPAFVQYRASSTATPALRAGNVQPYEFVLPPSWKQERVANILSGNYCQPKCAEPWVEVKFADANQGAVQVVAAPMVRLTNKTNATIEEIGSPENILAALGPFVTGNSFDPEEVTDTSVQRRGDQTYYTYELKTPFAKTGAHNLATATAKGSVVMLFVVSANDSQWSSSEKLLRSIVGSFSV